VISIESISFVDRDGYVSITGHWQTYEGQKIKWVIRPRFLLWPAPAMKSPGYQTTPDESGSGELLARFIGRGLVARK
jgi:hypothetical protein